MSEQLQTHFEIMREQDKQLEELLKSIVRQKQIAKQINQEIEGQNVLIDEFQDNVELTQSKLKFSQKRLDKLNGRSWSEWFKSWFN